MPGLDDISLMLTKAYKAGFLQDVKLEEENWLRQEAAKLFGDDRLFTSPTVRSSALGGGRLWVFAGDSITNGASSSNITVDSYRVLTCNFVGSHKVSPTSINAGVPGDRSDQLLNRLSSIMALGPEAAFVLIGTNDANQLVPLTTFQNNIMTIASRIKSYGIPLVIGTVPPRDSATSAAIHLLIAQYNIWLRLWAPRNGIKLVDVNAALTDKTTGYFSATYANADGIHPNDAGHIEIAKALTSAINEMIMDQPWPVNGPQPGVGMLTNPLMTGSPATSWAINAGIGSGIAGVQGVSPASDGLPYGQWSTLTMDGTTTAGSRYLLAPATGFAANDKILICGYIKSSDTSGTGLSINVLNSSTGVPVVPAPVTTLKTGLPGPIMKTFTIPASPPGASNLRIGIGQSVSVGQNITAYVGAMQAYNLTQLGLDSLV